MFSTVVQFVNKGPPACSPNALDIEQAVNAHVIDLPFKTFFIIFATSLVFGIDFWSIRISMWFWIREELLYNQNLFLRI